MYPPDNYRHDPSSPDYCLGNGSEEDHPEEDGSEEDGGEEASQESSRKENRKKGGTSKEGCEESITESCGGEEALGEEGGSEREPHHQRDLHVGDNSRLRRRDDPGVGACNPIVDININININGCSDERRKEQFASQAHDCLV